MYVIQQQTLTKGNKNYKTTKPNKKVNHDHVYTAKKLGTDQFELLHQRMGHISIGSLIKLKEAVTGIDIEEVSIKHDIKSCECQGCMLGKSHRYKFSSHSEELAPTDTMDMTVSDLCGPIFRKYLSTIIDVNGMVFLEILNKKSEAADQIMKWNTYATTQTGKVLKRFHSDGGGEYTSNRLKSFFEKQGTIMTTTTQNTPQHNGIAERMNRTILEMARSMLHHGHMHLSYWMDAVKTAVYLINRCFIISFKGKEMTRYEAWTGIKPSIEHLRVFGCDVYRHIPKDQRQNKISTTSSPGVFIGYDEEKNGYYKVWDSQEKKVYRTRDVEFHETSFTQATKQKFHMWTDYNQQGIDALLYQYDIDDIHSHHDTHPSIETINEPREQQDSENLKQKQVVAQNHKEQPIDITN